MNRISKSSRIVPVAWLEADQTAPATVPLPSRTTADGLLDEERLHRVRLALNEARALAWETDYPHLLYPLLAEEKLAELDRWQSRQRDIWSGSFELAFAA